MPHPFPTHVNGGHTRGSVTLNLLSRARQEAVFFGDLPAKWSHALSWAFMADEVFDTLEQALRSGGPDAGFELLVQKFREERKYPLLFEARLMKSRHALGLPLVQTERLEDLPEDKRGTHERAFMDAAREVGGLFLADGDVPRAWPYFRAIGETAPVF